MALEFKHQDYPRYYEISLLKDGEKIGEITIGKKETLPTNQEPRTHCWQVGSVEVDERFRRQGYATKLYEEALKVALDHGVALCSDFAEQLQDEAEFFWEKQVRAGRAYWEVPGPESERDDNFDYGRYVIDKPQPTLSGKKQKAQEKVALVIIHLSSLDSYTDLGVEAGRGMDPGYALAGRLAKAIGDHQGPVIIADQGWAFFYKDARPRRDLLEAIGFYVRDEQAWSLDDDVFTQEAPREITWIRFDEDEQDWDWFLDSLKDLLHDRDVDRVILGGLFFEKDLSEGCVTYTYEEIRQLWPTTVDPKLVGCVSDFYKTQALPGGYTRGTKNKKRS